MAGYADNVRKPPRTLTEREQRLLLKVTGEHRNGYRDHTLISMALATGLRAHELLALNVGDIFNGDRQSKRRVQLRVFKRSSQDTAQQEIILPEGLRAKLNKFYRWKKAQHESLNSNAPLFISRNANRLSARQLRHRFRQWQIRAGFDRLFSVHSLRHTSCTMLYRRTKDIRLVQRFARHKSILTTSIYAQPSDEELVRAVQDLLC